MTSPLYEPHTPLAGVPEDLQLCIPDHGVVHQTLWWSTQVTDAPPIYHVGSIYAFLALEAARRGWHIEGHVPALWVALLGDSATAKSTTFFAIQKLYDDFLRQELGELYPQLGNVSCEAEGTQAGILESLAEMYREDIARTPAMLFHDEFTKLLNKHNDGMSETLCKLADQRTVSRNLAKYKQMRREGVKNVPDTIKDPAISAVFCTTPESFEETVDRKMLEGGLLSRFLYCKAGLMEMTRRPWQAEKRETRTSALQSWFDLASWIIGSEACGTDKVIKLPPDVKARMNDVVFKRFDSPMSEGNVLNAQYRRAARQVFILAGLNAFSCSREVISDEDIDCAADFVALSLRGVEELLTQRVAVSPQYRKTAKALAIIESRKKAGIARSELYPMLRATKFEMDCAIAALEEQNAIRTVVVPREGRGRPLTIFYATKFDEDVAKDIAKGIAKDVFRKEVVQEPDAPE